MYSRRSCLVDTVLGQETLCSNPYFHHLRMCLRLAEVQCQPSDTVDIEATEAFQTTEPHMREQFRHTGT